MKPEDGVMNDRLEIVLFGAGSRELGPACIRDLRSAIRVATTV